MAKKRKTYPVEVTNEIVQFNKSCQYVDPVNGTKEHWFVGGQLREGQHYEVDSKGTILTPNLTIVAEKREEATDGD